jgi:hypothetical protein
MDYRLRRGIDHGHGCVGSRPTPVDAEIGDINELAVRRDGDPHWRGADRQRRHDRLRSHIDHGHGVAALICHVGERRSVQRRDKKNGNDQHNEWSERLVFHEAPVKNCHAETCYMSLACSIHEHDEAARHVEPDFKVQGQSRLEAFCRRSLLRAAG